MTAGEVVRGKWHGKQYKLQKKLGQGATGSVYLVSEGDAQYALKIAADSFSISAEVNVLQQLARVQGQHLGPQVYDVDDWESPQGLQAFYVMNVVDGVSLPQFVLERGKEWVPVIISQILSFLQIIHEQGWVFGDLKPDNLIISRTPPKVFWFDAGGMTKAGRAVKEYTEMYDRGSWLLGDRRAEPAYDLFSTGMIMLQLLNGTMLDKNQIGSAPVLKKHIFQTTSFLPYQHIIWNALTGKYGQAQEMKTDMMHQWQGTRNGQMQHVPASLSISRSQNRKHKSKQKKTAGPVLTFFLVTSFLFFVFAIILYIQP